MNIPFLNLAHAHAAIKAEMQAAFEAVYDGNWFILGQQLERFEADYAAFNQVKHAIGVSNGLDALVLALKALGVGPGDEVIVPSHTYIASVLAVSQVGATPVFVEPRMETGNLNPELIPAAITSSTRAIMPVHLYGQACEMDAILAIEQEHDLYVVEDNAQAHGATFKGKLTGSWGQINSTSFYPGKNLGALGDGGAVTTDEEALAEKVRMWRNYGSNIKYHNEVPGYNMRLDELQAAFLSVKLRHLAHWTAQRQQIATWYTAALQGIGDVVLPYTHPNATHVYHLYVIRTQHRDALQQHLKAAGIGTLIHYPIPSHLQKAYANLGYPTGSFPIAEELAQTVLSLPLWPGMGEEEIENVAQSIAAFFNQLR
jgi:dTDP-4-amino-4,6-dideoxygalactose transaminase